MRKKLLEMLAQVSQLFLGLALSITFYFFLLRFDLLKAGFQKGVTILMPFVYGGTMAYLLKTPCNFFERLLEKYLPEKLKKRKIGMAVLIVLIITFLIFYILLRSVVPQVVVSISVLARKVPKGTEQFFTWLSAYLKSDGVVQSYVQPMVEQASQEITAWANGDLLPRLEGMMGNVTDTISSILTVLSNLGVGMIVCIYALCARKKFARQGKALLYSIFKSESADKIMDEICFIDKTFDGFISGKVLDSAIVGLICYVFCVIMSLTRGFTNGVLISLIIGVTNIIPYFGPFIGAIPSVLLISISSPVNALIFLVFVIILQQFDGNYLGPRLLAGSVGLSGFWVLFSITLFSGIFGFVGVLIGVPVFAVVYDLIRKMIIKGLQNHNRMDLLESEETNVELSSDTKKEERTVITKKNDIIRKKKEKEENGSI